MGKLVAIISLALLIFTACQENNSILEPNSTDFESPNTSINYTDKQTDDFSQRVSIVLEDTLFERTIYSKHLTVDGTKGGKVSIQYLYKGKDDRIQRLAATLTIPQNAYEGELTFEIIFDLKNLGVELYPSPFTFDKPVILDLTFFNVDLSTFDLNSLTFDYLDGEATHLSYDKLLYDVNNGSLTIRGAQIPHFSRYGWTRRR